ncbi:MAG: EAL domain-containing protein [Reinekea sp.]|jgi:diguanylate cyclase (GGDEF)-like protein/PAS domain S-box-containing protein
MSATRILIVEDERIVGLNLQQRLIRLGYDVPALAVNAPEALDATREYHPDLILMDIHIEGDLDGIEAVKLIQESYKTPIIYLTAYSEESTLARARETGPHGYLLKPFSERELHATIQMALERTRIEKALSQNETRLRLALSAADMTDWELKRNETGEVLSASEADSILGYSERLFSGDRDDFIQLVSVEDRKRVNRVIDQSLSANQPCDVEFRAAQPVRWLRLQGKVINEPANNLLLVGVIQNITDRKNAEQRLKEAAMVFDVTQDGILILDTDGMIISTNQSFSSLTGFQYGLVFGHLKDYVDLKQLRAAAQAELDSVLSEGGSWRQEVKIICHEQRRLSALMTINSVNTEQNPDHFVVVITDITTIRSMEKQLEFLAHHDPLTGLPNRLLTKERLTQAVLRGKRQCERFAVAFIDVDHFKWINDSLGHEIGDIVLKEVVSQISDCLRANDTIGRLGGDEFLIILDPIQNERSVITVIEKIMRTICKPMTVNEHIIEISCSVGLSLFPDDGGESDTLIRTADSAMYEAKRNGRHRYKFFTPAMMEKANRFMKLNHDLRRGFQENEFSLYYQPQVTTAGNTHISGAEALIRWHHPNKGLISPKDIIPVAEDSGMIIEIGEWVLRQACIQMKSWQDHGFSVETISVNVSPLQLVNGHFIRSLKHILTETLCPADCLELEVTESMLQNDTGALKSLEKVKKLGVKIAIDDFGTGYSSLSSLKFLPISRLKIDQSFVIDIPRNKDDVAIVELIIDIAHKLNMQVTAEGVETVDQLKLLLDRHCDQIQGYYFYKPLAKKEITELLIFQQQEQTRPDKSNLNPRLKPPK